MRDANLSSMIRANFPRNADGQEQLSLNTYDTDNSNRRKAKIVVKIQPLHIVAISTNVPAKTDKENEEYRTLSAVIQVCLVVFSGMGVCLY
jgi:hypothetical protein